MCQWSKKGLNDSLQWTNNVIKYQRMYEDYKANQLPTVRPMSELPEGNIQVVFIVTNTKEDSWTYGIGTPLNLEAIIVNNQSYFKDKNYCAAMVKYEA